MMAPDDMTARGRELKELLERIGWSNNEAARRVGVSFAWMGQMRNGTREISDGWLVYFRTVDRLISQIALPTGETDDVSDLPLAITVDGLTPFQKAEREAMQASRQEAVMAVAPVLADGADGRSLPRDAVLMALIESFQELRDDLTPDQVRVVNEGMLMVADRLGLAEELIAGIKALPRAPMPIVTEAALANTATFELPGRRPAFQEMPDN